MLKMGMDYRGQVQKRVLGNHKFLSEKGSEFGRKFPILSSFFYHAICVPRVTAKCTPCIR